MSDDKPNRSVRWVDVIVFALAGAVFVLSGVLILTGNSESQPPALAIAKLVLAVGFFGVAINKLRLSLRERKPAV